MAELIDENTIQKARIVRYLSDFNFKDPLSSTKDYEMIPYDVSFLEEYVYADIAGCVVCHEVFYCYYSRKTEFDDKIAEHVMDHFFEYIIVHQELALSAEPFYLAGEKLKRGITFEDDKTHITITAKKYLSFIFSKVTLKKLTTFVLINKMVRLLKGNDRGILTIR